MIQMIIYLFSRVYNNFSLYCTDCLKGARLLLLQFNVSYEGLRIKCVECHMCCNNATGSE